MMNDACNLMLVAARGTMAAFVEGLAGLKERIHKSYWYRELHRPHSASCGWKQHLVPGACRPLLRGDLNCGLEFTSSAGSSWD